MNSRLRWLVMLVLALVVTAACGAVGSSGNAALVNSKGITLKDYNTQVRIVQDSMVEQGLDLKTDDGKATLEQMKSDILDQMIDIELMRQAAIKEGINVTEADVDARMTQIKKDAGGDAAFKQSLDDAKLTEAEFRTLILKDQIIYERLYKKLSDALPTSAEQVHARHILVDSEKAAADVVARLKKGEDFAAIAKAVSLDTGSNADGGDLGFFPRGVMDATFETAVFALKINDIGTVLTDYGYHVIQVMEKEASRAIAADIVQVLGDQAINTYIEGLRSSGKIERLVKFTVAATPSQ